MCESQEVTLEERYEMLKSLCKQQIMINEVLKSEITRLNNVIRNISRERSTLLDELIVNHSTCQNPLKDNSKTVKTTSDLVNKRTLPVSVENSNGVKHMKREPSATGEYEEGLSAPIEQLPIEVTYSQDLENHWTCQNQETSQSRPSVVQPSSLLSPTTPNKGRLHYQITQVRPSTNPLKLSNIDCATADSGVHSAPLSDSNRIQKCSGSGSPPAIATTTQRTSKLASLVTNSTICSPSPSIPFVSFTSQRPSGTGVQPKYVSVANRSVKVVSSGISNIPSFGQGVSSNSILKSVTPPSISSGLRFSTSPTSSRITIQSNNMGTMRPVFIPRPQTHASDNTCEIGYSER